MSVLIGNARISENGTVTGEPGDSTGREVCTQAWYLYPSGGWNCVIRPKSAAVAEKLAKAMEQACANNNIGYSWYGSTTDAGRTGCYYRAKEKSWDLSKITTKCNTDCSALTAVCCNAAGAAVSKDTTTYTMAANCKATGMFSFLTDSRYLTTDAYLKRGDILLNTTHHVCVVLSNGSKAGSSTTAAASGSAATTGSTTGTTAGTAAGAKLKAAKYFDRSYAGTYKVTASALYMRYGADKEKDLPVTILRNAEQAVCYGYYNIAPDGTKWLLVVAAGKTGYCSLKYLTRV